MVSGLEVQDKTAAAKSESLYSPTLYTASPSPHTTRDGAQVHTRGPSLQHVLVTVSTRAT